MNRGRRSLIELTIRRKNLKNFSKTLFLFGMLWVNSKKKTTIVVPKRRLIAFGAQNSRKQTENRERRTQSGYILMHTQQRTLVVWKLNTKCPFTRLSRSVRSATKSKRGKRNDAWRETKWNKRLTQQPLMNYLFSSIFQPVRLFSSIESLFLVHRSSFYIIQPSTLTDRRQQHIIISRFTAISSSRRIEIRKQHHRQGMNKKAVTLI